ncbi:MAG: Ig-like domain-containing protein [Eubacterium sp.]|nr:Ig-like domain-containing protein [Eubacterium sp.]
MGSEKKILKKIISSLSAVLLAVCLFMLPEISVCTQATEVKELTPSVDTVLETVGNYILSVDTNPDYSSTWNVVGLLRSGRTVPTGYIETYYNNTVNYLENNDWKLSRTKYSDYSKLIIGMTAIGKDVRDIDGHNILSYLSDYSKVKLQGFNGPVWALIALNCHPDYEIPLDLGASEQTTEEGLIEYILKRETTKGGWTLYGDTPDTDITGMTIQALSSYYGKRDDVTEAIDRALSWLSSSQNEEGGYSTLNGNSTTETSESDAQVIVALSALGIDSAADSRFIQPNGKGVLSRLFDYYISAGDNKAGFMHVFAGSDNNGGGAAGTLNGMATEQGMYATAAYKRLLTGKTALYDMSDIEISPGEKVDPVKPDATTQKQEETTKSSSKTTQTKKTTTKKKVTGLYLDYKQISVQKGKTRTLKLTISPSNASNKKVKWSTSNKKIATVTQKGKVKGIKAGKAKITVTARDGSKKKANCIVVVYTTGGNTSSSGNRNGSSSSTTRYSGQTTGGQSNGYWGNSTSGNGSGNQATINNGNTGGGNPSGNTSSNGNTSGTNPEGNTQAGAWTFDGDSYVPESGETTVEDNDVTEEDSWDAEEDTEEDEEEMISEEEEEEGSHLPAWLSVLFGLFSTGGIAATMKVPWLSVRDKLWILIFSKRRRR